MKLLFSNSRSIGLVSEDFARCFPFLRLRFFNTICLPGQTSLWDEEMPGSTQLGEITNMDEPIFIYLGPSATVASFEKEVFDRTGLVAKVFRRQNKRWVEVRRIKDSLERLNAIGMAYQYNSFNYHTLFL